MIEPRAQLCGRDAKVGAEEAFSPKKALKLHAHGMLQISHATHMAGSIPGVRTWSVYFFQLAEVGRRSCS